MTVAIRKYFLLCFHVFSSSFELGGVAIRRHGGQGFFFAPAGLRFGLFRCARESLDAVAASRESVPPRRVVDFRAHKNEPR